jgi:hypothetical protein
MTLLNEAGQAGPRLGSDHNHWWTAFGPVNVLLHRINVAVRLGDAGSAISYARKLNLDQLTVTERKASFFVDTAQAFSQWGKHQNALNALRAAEELAPQRSPLPPRRTPPGGRPARHRATHRQAPSPRVRCPHRGAGMTPPEGRVST